MADTVDLLQIKIEKARAELPASTLKAIDAVPWRATILQLKETMGYSFEQLGDLEIETELVLSGLLSPQDYPKELESRMGINKTQADELVKEMNLKVFSKIREELIKNTEKNNLSEKTEKIPTKETDINPKPIEVPVVSSKNEEEVLNLAGIKIIPNMFVEEIKPTENITQPNSKKIELTPKPATIEHGVGTPPIFVQKLSGSLQTPIVKTEHSLENITKNPDIPLKKTAAPSFYPPKGDPYRLPPE